ncbi:hypothetical protein VNO77_03222 [Canavalia gladiata]|uniref:Uncharacterized protein n=1 Tax=Canavalia gladiata TaxID=3824 RepID=A0AAN9R6P7_CANGL
MRIAYAHIQQRRTGPRNNIYFKTEVYHKSASWLLSVSLAHGKGFSYHPSILTSLSTRPWGHTSYGTFLFLSELGGGRREHRGWFRSSKIPSFQKDPILLSEPCLRLASASLLSLNFFSKNSPVSSISSPLRPLYSQYLNAPPREENLSNPLF